MNIVRKNMYSSYKLSKFQSFCPYVTPKQFISYLGKWENPQGYDTGIIVHNSAINKKVPLVLKKKDFASWYICGPTVYAESHIGHASCYVRFDIIRRILEKIFSIDVFLLLGITDIDDKIIKRSNQEGISASQLAKQYEMDFFQDMERMRVLPATSVSRVSENIALIVSFCEKLIEKDFAYVTNEGNVYFMVSKGITSDVENEIPEAQETHVDASKRDPRDFALWKAAKPNEPFWNSPWGDGRPGWHIECSAMASKIFGSSIDLHSGGFDLLFPHHSNEISQSQAYHNCSQWVNYWMHAGLLQVDDEFKMSKSLGNTISIKDFLKEHSVNDFRILCLQSTYRKNLIYCSETLAGAKSLHKKIHNFINDCESYIVGELKGSVKEDVLLSKLSDTKEQVINFLKNDFNTSQALLCLTDFIDEVNKSLPVSNNSSSVTPTSILVIARCYFYVNNILDTLGVNLLSKKKLPKDLLFAIDIVIEFRNKIRMLARSPKIVGHGTKLSHFVESSFRVMEKELLLISKSEMHKKFTIDLLNDSKTFYQKAFQFTEQLDSNKTLHEDLKPKQIKEIMSPVFRICDEFRSTLYEKGIEIKDRGSDSCWIPLMEFQKKLFDSP